MNIDIDDRVVTKVGIGKVIKVDTVIYSIPFCLVLIDEGRFKGETVFISMAELKPYCG